MARATKKRPGRLLALDADRLGLVVGLAAAVVVMVACFYREVPWGATFIRAGWVFVVAYAAAFFLVRLVLRTTLAEMLHDKKHKRESRRAAERDAASARVEAASRPPQS